MTCPDCGDELHTVTDIAHMRRTGQYRYQIVCSCGYERDADPANSDDNEIIERDSERYWTRHYERLMQ